MARTRIDIVYNCDYSKAESIVNNILINNGFHTTTLKTGENVWKKGTGMLTAMQFIKIDYAHQKMIVSAWVQVGIGNVGGGEMDLSGFVGALPKKMLMKVLEQIKAAF